MAAFVAALKTSSPRLPVPPAWLPRALAVATLAMLALAVPGAATPLTAVVVDAYLEIAVFVAFTLAVVYGAEALSGTGVGEVMARNPRLQVPLGAALGALPGCGGAIVAVTQFTRGSMSFGGLVATLIATGGDAVFLLIAAEPGTAAAVIGLAVALALPFGYALDAVLGPDHLRPRPRVTADAGTGASTPPRLGATEWLWLALMGPAAVVAIPLTIANVDVVEAFGPAAEIVAIVGAALGLGLWVRHGDIDKGCESHCETGSAGLATRVMVGTNFVLAWAVFAMAGYELAVLGFGLEPERLFAAAGVLVPAVAILIGFIPGCGPQVLVTSLYVAGVVPLSAQIGNAISNDGDALFPAIALAPKAAVMATVYSAIPAFLAAYAVYALVG